MTFRKAAVLGAGACFRKMLPGIRAAFEIAAIYDPNPNAVGWPLLSDVETYAATSTEDEFFERAASAGAIFILSPPRQHVSQLERAAALGVPVFLEKPPAIDRAGIVSIDRVIARNPKVYFSDLYADVRAAALIRACRGRLRGTEWLVPHIEGPFDPARIDLLDNIGSIRSITAHLLETEPAGARSWLNNSAGGGVLLDLAVHHLTLYFVLFDAPLVLSKLEWNRKQAAAETHAFASFRSEAGFPVEIEVAHGWPEDRRAFRIVGSRGEALMEFGAAGTRRNVLRIGLNGEKLEFGLSPHYWDLVTEGFLQYLQTPMTVPHNYRESKAALEAIFQAMGRAELTRRSPSR